MPTMAGFSAFDVSSQVICGHGAGEARSGGVPAWPRGCMGERPGTGLLARSHLDALSDVLDRRAELLSDLGSGVRLGLGLHRADCEERGRPQFSSPRQASEQMGP